MIPNRSACIQKHTPTLCGLREVHLQKSPLKMLLFIDSCVRSLLDFEKYSILKHMKAVAAADHQHDISLGELARGDQLPLVVVDIDLTAAPAHDKNFRSSYQMSL